jgi:AraC family transcriptional regulator, transcriptional activator of pobA
MMEGFSKLLAVADRFEFKTHRIGHLLDQTGRYDEKLDREFPFLIRLFHFRARQFTQGTTWHERLELFVPLDGPCPIRVGETMLALAPGDLLVLDNAKVHQVVDHPQLNTRVVVVSFLSEFVYSLGSPSYDYMFLLPFYTRANQTPHVLKQSDRYATSVYSAAARLLEAYFDTRREVYRPAACKAFLLEILYFLACHFHSSLVLESDFVQQQERVARLKKLFDFVSVNYADKITLSQAAGLASLSKPQFTRVFKKVAGMTFVNYVNHMRITHAARLLRESRHTIADIASQVGFTDQSYLTRQFRRSFGCSPRQFRNP